LAKADQPQPLDITPSSLPEEYVLAELNQHSPEFIAFYQEERPKIEGPLQWIQDPSLPEGIDYRSTTLDSGQRYVRLRRVPATLADATKIAHELEHFVLNSEGFPSTGARRQFEVLSSALNSMVHDPLVNSRLQPYGFDLRADYEQEIEETKRQLASTTKSPTDHLDGMHWTINYVGHILEWRVAFDTTRADQPEFQRWFDARYPAVATRGHQLLSLVDTLGFDTSEKQFALLNEIIGRYRLAPWLIVMQPGSSG
jgi:hypothetical protein